MIYGHVADEGDNLNIYIYDYVVARSTTPANKNFFENPCFFSPVP